MGPWWAAVTAATIAPGTSAYHYTPSLPIPRNSLVISEPIDCSSLEWYTQNPIRQNARVENQKLRKRMTIFPSGL